MSFFPFAQKQLGFKRPPKLFFVNDEQNAGDTLGKTAYYEPETETIKVYVTNRHPKDVLRSFSHELVHHAQNCRGDFDNDTVTEEGYAQNDPHLREMEREAYEKGNMIFRDYCDGLANNGGLEEMSMTEDKLREAVRAAIQRLAEKKEDKDLEEKFDAKKADLNKDGKLSGYEKKRGEAAFGKKKEEKLDEYGADPNAGTPFASTPGGYVEDDPNLYKKKKKKPKEDNVDEAHCGKADDELDEGSIADDPEKAEEAEAKERDAEEGGVELDESPSHPADGPRNTGRRQKNTSTGEREETVNEVESVDELKEWYLGTLSEALIKKFTK